MNLDGKNVVYLGGFGGIGQQCTREFLQKGIKHLVILDLHQNTSLLEELQKGFPSTTVSFIKMDITDTQNIKDAYKEAVAKIGHIDVVVNGCGIMDDHFVDLTIQINLLGLIHSTLTAMEYMDKSKGGQGGVIANISSVAGLIPSPAFAIYCASKNGVTAFTRALGTPIYYESTGISFITICPGITETNMSDKPEEKVTSQHAVRLTDISSRLERQSAADCAKNLVRAIEIAKTGSVWLLDIGEMKEVEIPTLWTPTLKSS